MMLNIFDDKVPYNIRDGLWERSITADFKLGWADSDEPEKYNLNIHSDIHPSFVAPSGILPYFEQCIDDTEWFNNTTLDRIVLNVVKSDDVHYMHVHTNTQILLYYINLDWRDGWYGETLFYDPYDTDRISFTSPYKPGRIILFDGSIPHAIRPPSIKGPKFRFSLSLFFV